MSRRLTMPPVRVVRERGRSRSLRSRVAAAVEPARPAAAATVEVALGFWPLWVVLSFIVALSWAFAYSHSP